MAEQSKAKDERSPSGLIKNRWVASLVSLLIGLGLGTTVGKQVLDTAGVPASCVRTIQRADRALGTGTAVANDGRAALDAVKGLHFGEAGDLLGRARKNASSFFHQVGKFNTSRKSCKEDRAK